MASVPNQKEITIHRNKYKDNFLQIGIDEWQNVAKLEGNSKSVLIIYLYLASNKDGYSIFFSPQDMVNLFGQSVRTWERALDVLIKNNYVIWMGGNHYQFYLTPQNKDEVNINCDFKDFVRMGEKQQEKIYLEILKIDWDKMTKEQNKIHDYYVEYVMGDD